MPRSAQSFWKAAKIIGGGADCKYKSNEVGIIAGLLRDNIAAKSCEDKKKERIFLKSREKINTNECDCK